MFSIGELSKRTGVKAATIRYYEQAGLIEEPHRSLGNQRRYQQHQLEKLLFIRHARDLGFSLQDIGELLGLHEDEHQSCEKAHQIARQHLKAVDERIEKLQSLKKELQRIEAMSDAGHVEDCRVIEALTDHSLCEGEH